MTGFSGDTLASALMANDAAIVGRSFKYHRPRGILGAREEDPNGLVDLGTSPRQEPNARATMTPLSEGLVVRSINCWPGPEFDIGAVIGLAAPLLRAGFYYKTFMWPYWHLFEPTVRCLAGLGQAPTGVDPDRYDHRSAYCDVLIVGGGLAGLRTALHLAPSGMRVTLVEQDHRFGGALVAGSEALDGLDGGAWVALAVATLGRHQNVTLLTDATATGHYDHRWVTVSQRHRAADPTGPRETLWTIRAKNTVIATGAHERPMVFRNNDRPGVMLASAVREFAGRYGVAAGRKVLFAGNNSSVYQTAFDAQDRGINVVGIIDTRSATGGAASAEAAAVRRIPVFPRTDVEDVLGGRQVRGVRLSGPDGVRNVGCDCLAVSGGWSPVLHLMSHGAGKLVWDDARLCFMPPALVDGMIAVGSANGRFDSESVLADARRAADWVARVSPGAEAPASGVTYSIEERWKEVARPGSCWVDLLHDVTVQDVKIAVREGFASVEHFKRYTTNGMAPDQGKTPSIISMAILARETGRLIAEAGTTKFRPPYTPVTLGALAGPYRGGQYEPRWRLALNDWHIEHGGRMDTYGGWTRPAYYSPAGETEQEAIAQEVSLVRSGVGMLDYSALGKIDVIGPDAAKFLDLVYMNSVSTLKPGGARYGLMLNETGSIRDDGVFGRLSETHFMLTTTSGGAAATAGWIGEWHQCEWPGLDVIIQPFTTYWGTISVAGPSARQVMQQVASDIDFSAAGFPHMSIREGKLGGTPVRIMRVSFSGEITYEISMPFRRMMAIWTALLESGRGFGIRPFGLEALLVMRIEKGFIHVGSETDSATLPADFGYGQLGAKKDVHFIGRRSLHSPFALNPNREHLVGLEPLDGATILHAGGQVVAAPRRPATTEGRVTSGCWSPTLGRPIALAVVRRGRERHGDNVAVYQRGRFVLARIVAPVFFDAAGERMNG